MCCMCVCMYVLDLCLYVPMYVCILRVNAYDMMVQSLLSTLRTRAQLRTRESEPSFRSSAKNPLPQIAEKDVGSLLLRVCFAAKAPEKDPVALFKEGKHFKLHRL